MARRYRRYGAPMICLELRQAGLWVNHKRVERGDWRVSTPPRTKRLR